MSKKKNRKKEERLTELDSPTAKPSLSHPASQS